MKSSKSINSLASQQINNERFMQPNSAATLMSNSVDGPTSPICRCRVTYLGSSVPHITKDGLQGIQEPLKELYPDRASLASGNRGIDSWLSIWSNGILVENVDDSGHEMKRFFKIESLHYCAAVKFVPQLPQQLNNPYSTLSSNANLPKFLPLDSPQARQQGNLNPPIFASILRRTTGIKVLECHAFICKREAAANALVRCCFHAYADTMYAKQIGADADRLSSEINNNIANRNDPDSRSNINANQNNNNLNDFQHKINGNSQPMASRRSKSIANLNDSAPRSPNDWTHSESSECYYETANNQSEYHYPTQSSVSVTRRKSMNEQYSPLTNGMTKTRNQEQSQNHQQQNPQQMSGKNIQKLNNLSKSMHQLNLEDYPNGNYDHQSGGWPYNSPIVPQQPFYNPYSSRIPSYPPQNLMEVNGGSTLKSIKSMAATSIASTLLRSKKHAKAMSMAQLNQEKVMSFHQPHSNGSTLGPPPVMPPVPPMFLMNMPRNIVNGSQTMKPNRPMMPVVGPPMNFEAMTPKEMKKLLKKSAKYGLDPSKFSETGLPLLPLRPPATMMPLNCQLPPNSKSGTMISQSMYSMDGRMGQDVADHGGSIQGFPIPRGAPIQHDFMDPQLKPILVKPNSEFLKSKAGKKWIKQQKEFKKLLPPHLDGLPIVFGPPPAEVLEPATIGNNMNLPPPQNFMTTSHSGLPVMDASGYYNPHPFYGPSGRASAASTLLRHSPHSQMILENSRLMMNSNQPEYMQPNQSFHGHHMGMSMVANNQGDFSNDNSSAVYNSCDHNDQIYANNGYRHQSSNHMVEQSVISLGDENDYDDEDSQNEIEGGQNGYYSSTNSQAGQAKYNQYS